MRPFTIRDNEEISIVRSLTGEEYPVGTTGEGFMNEGRLAVRSSLWDQNRPDNSTGDASTGPPRIPPTGGEASAALPVPMSSPEAVTSKRCRIPAHEHGILVTLHSVECKGAQLGLLARVTPDEAQALADAACGVADVPSVPVEFIRAPNRKPGHALGWYCGDTPFPLFRYPARIVLNRAHGGDNLRTLAHELAHHVVGVRRIRECGARPPRRYRPHGHPFPETYREMVEYVHTQVAAQRELTC